MLLLLCREVIQQPYHIHQAHIRRGYELGVYDTAVESLHGIGVNVVTHLIIGLPGETPEMLYDSVCYVGRVTDGIKLQLLHVIKGTDLAVDYEKGLFKVLSMEEYAELLGGCISRLPKNVAIHRLTGDGDKRSLIAPLWSSDKKRVLNFINRYFDEHDIMQGSLQL